MKEAADDVGDNAKKAADNVSDNAKKAADDVENDSDSASYRTKKTATRAKKSAS